MSRVVLHSERNWFEYIVCFGNQAKSDPEFKYWKLIIRTIVINIVAAACLWIFLKLFMGDLRDHRGNLEKHMPNMHDL
jgi:hypothetical protein